MSMRFHAVRFASASASLHAFVCNVHSMPCITANSDVCLRLHDCAQVALMLVIIMHSRK